MQQPNERKLSAALGIWHGVSGEGYAIIMRISISSQRAASRRQIENQQRTPPAHEQTHTMHLKKIGCTHIESFQCPILNKALLVDDLVPNNLLYLLCGQKCFQCKNPHTLSALLAATGLAQYPFWCNFKLFSMAFPTASPLRFDFAIASPAESNVCTVCSPPLTGNLL